MGEDYASMVLIGLWVFFFLFFGYGWWFQVEKWWKRKVVGLWLLWFVVVAGVATMELLCCDGFCVVVYHYFNKLFILF